MTHLLFVAPLLLTAAVIFLAPELTPRYTLFGVRISPGFRRSQVGRQTIVEFRAAVLLGFLLALAVVLFVPASTASVLAPPLLVTAPAVAAWVRQYRRLKPFAFIPGAQPAQIELSAHLDDSPSFLWLSLIPCLLLLAAALYLHAHWNSIPMRFPIHWNVQGQPNGWAERSARGVYGLLIFAALLNTWLVVLALSIWHGVRRSNYRRAVVQILVAAQFPMALIPCVIALSPLWKIGPVLLTTVALLSVAGVIAFAVWIFMRTIASPRPDSVGLESDGTPQNAWTGGVLYFNRQDPALAVPRRDGFGYTINFARPLAVVLIVAPFVIVYVSLHWIF